MLVISRKVSESILIGDTIEILISEINGDRVKIAVNAPKSIPIMRKELLETSAMNKEAGSIPRQEALDKLRQILK